MKFVLAVLVTVFTFATLITDHAKAENISFNVKSGQARSETVWYYDPSGCTHMGIRNIKIRKKPKHGKLTWARKYITVPKGQKCAGKRFKAVVFTYRSKRGYRGRDRAKVSYSAARYTNGNGNISRGWNVTINVK